MIDKRNTFRRGQQAHDLDALHMIFFQNIDSCTDGATRRKHGFQNNRFRAFDVCRQLAVIVLRLKCIRFPVNPQMPDLDVYKRQIMLFSVQMLAILISSYEKRTVSLELFQTAAAPPRC